jgi:hypothetical protein
LLSFNSLLLTFFLQWRFQDRLLVNINVERAEFYIAYAKEIKEVKGDVGYGYKQEIKVGDHATFYGDIVAGDYIRDSYNRAAESDKSEELKELLKELALAVGNLTGELAEEKAKEVADDLETFTKEAVRENPRRKWWELSAEGIKEAAQSVGEVGKTVLDLLARLLPLLA